MQLLDPKTLPLNQNALIEASAGTGKTYTITSLYLRALLGLTDNSEELTPKAIEQILVVTFTEAATQEIRDRVRKKLVEAQQALLVMMAAMDSETELKVDANIQAITQAILEEFIKRFQLINPEASDEQAALAAYHQLQDAITLIDEASIFTIHGFCHRCLKQFAFETQSSFEQQFEMDGKSTLQRALFDFWRQQVSDLKSIEFEWFNQYWRSPMALYADISQVLGKQIQLKPETSTEQYQTLLTQHQELVQKLKVSWQQTDFTAALTNSKLKKNSKLYKRIPVLDGFIQSEQNLMALGKGESWLMWGTESLSNQANYAKNAETISSSVTKTIDQLSEIEEQLKQGRFQSYWLTQAKTYIESRSQQIKQEQQVINPDDLLSNLLKAINSSQGQSLLDAIRQKYPLAFIDEFQDTDPIQYQIFSSIYSETNTEQTTEEDENTSEANMILIGDPKQAIYKFRGADIYTYIKAKTDLDEKQHYTLGTNWRSHPELIAGVNTLFSQSEQGFLHKSIPFIEVDAGKSAANQLLLNNKPAKNVCFNLLTPEVDENATKPITGFSSSDGESLLAKWCANDIYQLLLGTKAQKNLISNQAVKASNISILVRNRHQARLIKNALAEFGVSSVYISRDNIFQTELGQDLWRLLQAINSPNNEVNIRSACTGRYFNYSNSKLLALQQSPELWQQHLVLFHQANELWLQGKVGLAIESIVEFADSYGIWHQDETIDHHRLITDHRHLIELLQQQAVKTSGLEKLLTWFEQQLLPDEQLETSEEKQIRLESDNNLVQITTLHASKGLEYPIVYLPFICEAKPEKTAIYTSQSEENQRLTYRVDNRELELQIAEQERLAEDIRLLYVAMTRPIYRLVVGVYNLIDRSKKSLLPQSAFGQLLLPEEIRQKGLVDSEVLTEFCQAYSEAQPDVFELVVRSQQQVIDEANQEQQTLQPIEQTTKCSLEFEAFDGEIDDSWKIISYSSLVAGHSTSHNTKQQNEELANELELNRVADEMSALDTDLILTQTNTPALNQFNNVFDFPKGANAGTCLHWILENLDFTEKVETQSEIVEQGLSQFGIEIEWLSLTIDWFQKVLDTSILKNTEQSRLKQLTDSEKLVEMEFYFNFNELNKGVIGNALSMLGLTDLYINQFVFNSDHSNSISGVLKGFVDLTAKLDGKYYVIDYKSNYLGDEISDYQQPELAQVMSDHNYYLQALIYILALHRFLKLRLVDYDYDTHIGGALYLFLRGMTGEQTSTSNTGVFEFNVSFDVIDYLDKAIDGEQISVQKPQKEQSQDQQLGFGFE